MATGVTITYSLLGRISPYYPQKRLVKGTKDKCICEIEDPKMERTRKQ